MKPQSRPWFRSRGEPKAAPASRSVRSWRRGLSARLRRLDFLLLAVMLAVVLGGWTFLEIAEEVLEEDAQQIDQAILMALREPGSPGDPLGPKWLEETARDLTALGSVPVLALASAAVGAYFLMRRMYAALALLAGATLGGQLLIAILKWSFGRARPDIVPHLASVFTPSFPSAHSTLSAVVYLTLGTILARLVDRRRIKVYFIAMALFVSFLVGLSRIYLGVHYPTDVLAGWSLGLVWALVCWLAARALQRRGAVGKIDGASGDKPGDRDPAG